MKTIKKLLTILLIAFATVAGAQNNWYAPSVFHEKVSFKKEVSQTDGSDSLTLRTIGTNSTLNHGLGTLLLNNSKSAIGLFNGTGYRVAATATNIQLQQGATDSILINFSGDTAHVNATVNAWKFTPKLDANSVTGFWDTSGNAGTNPATNFLGTTDHKALVIKTNDSLTITQDGRYIINDTVTHTQVGIYNAKRTGVRGWCAERSNGTTVFNSYLQETDVDKQTGGMGAFDTAKLCCANISVGHNENNEYFAQFQYGYGGADTAFRNELIADSLGIRIGLQNAAVATTFQVDNNVETIFGVTKDGAYYLPIGATDGYVFTVDGSGFATWTNPSSIDYSSVPSYANNAAAFAVLGAGKLYYTDVAGEYILKVTH